MKANGNQKRFNIMAWQHGCVLEQNKKKKKFI